VSQPVGDHLHLHPGRQRETGAGVVELDGWPAKAAYRGNGRPKPSVPGVTFDTMGAMPMTLRLSEAEAAALRARAKREARSMQDVARQAVREYVENHSKADLLDRVLDEELPRYAEALERLGQ
jgi:hypothetical protein